MTFDRILSEETIDYKFIERTISIEISTSIVHLVCVRSTIEVSKCRKCSWEGREYIRFPRRVRFWDEKQGIDDCAVARCTVWQGGMHIPRIYRWDMFLVFNG